MPRSYSSHHQLSYWMDHVIINDHDHEGKMMNDYIKFIDHESKITSIQFCFPKGSHRPAGANRNPGGARAQREGSEPGLPVGKT